MDNVAEKVVSKVLKELSGDFTQVIKAAEARIARDPPFRNFVEHLGQTCGRDMRRGALIMYEALSEVLEEDKRQLRAGPGTRGEISISDIFLPNPGYQLEDSRP